MCNPVIVDLEVIYDQLFKFIDLICFMEIFQEHKQNRGESYGDPLDLDNQITSLPVTSEVKQNENMSPYGAISNGESKPASPEGRALVFSGKRLSCL